MKNCKKCGAEYESDEVFCQACGERLINDSAAGYCKYCGRELVNEYEQEHGCCVHCEDTAGTVPEFSKPVKYKKRLKTMEILNYIAGAIAFILLSASGQVLFGVLGLIVSIGNGALYGAVREILKRL